MLTITTLIFPELHWYKYVSTCCMDRNCRFCSSVKTFQGRSAREGDCVPVTYQWRWPRRDAGPLCQRRSPTFMYNDRLCRLARHLPLWDAEWRCMAFYDARGTGTFHALWRFAPESFVVANECEDQCSYNNPSIIFITPHYGSVVLCFVSIHRKGQFCTVSLTHTKQS